MYVLSGSGFGTRAGGATLRFSTWIYGHTLNTPDVGQTPSGQMDGRTDILKSTTMWGSLRLAPMTIEMNCTLAGHELNINAASLCHHVVSQARLFFLFGGVAGSAEGKKSLVSLGDIPWPLQECGQIQ